MKHLNDPKAFIEPSRTMDYTYNDIDDYKPRKIKTLTMFHDMITGIMTNKKFQFINKELLIKRRKLNTSPVFITQTYLLFQKEVSLISSHYLIMKIPNKVEIKQIATNHSGDIDYENFVKIYMKCTRESYSFLTIDNTLLASNPLRLK